jgi:peptidyl-prolyl cis-trans isomerase SurA
MKKAFLSLAALPLLTGLSPQAQGARVVERVIARINNDIVTQRQYDEERKNLRARLAQDYSGMELESQYREQSKNLLRDLIDQDLMVQKAKDLGINVETDVVKRLDDIRKQNNIANQDALQKMVEKQGLVWEDFQDQIRRQLQMREVIGREVGGRIIVSHEEARKYFDAHKDQFSSPEGVRLGEILISNDKHKPDEVEQRAKDALAELKSGQKFSVVAKKYSDSDSAQDGGDVGFFKAGTLAPELEAAVRKLDAGQTSDLIKTKFGYDIIKVLDRRHAGIPSYEDVEQQVTNHLYDERIQTSLRKYLNTLRQESFTYLAPGYVDSGAVRPSEATPLSAANTLDQDEDK